METAAFPTTAIGTLHGVQEVDLLTAPGAGNEWSYTVPSGYYRRLLCGYSLFTTSATVANRFPGVRITDGSSTLFVNRDITALTAGVAYDLSYMFGLGLGNAGVVSQTALVLLPQVWLPPGYVLASTTTGKASGDAYTNIALWWECIDRQFLTEKHLRALAILENPTFNITEGHSAT